ncbi:D-xylulose 5-phosphate/D-fructose 6-phosphate phosphoketolase [Gautieria morchelliformis]|nr:D-xylulose 5-phosphate/D-fructose 6-phosphate phosphoketolase [Gautieria morchelliformis]
MPGQQLAQPNPPPEPSHLPEKLLELRTQLDTVETLSKDDLHAIKAFRRAACYISAAMLFLRSDTLLERKLTKQDIKPRILGHWGTDPGLILCYAHSNLLVKKHDLNALFVTGPGHGAPAILASLWLESSLSRFMPRYSLDKGGLHNLISGFSTPGGFPSHVNAETPGSIHEGGELGYALAVAFGAVMDYPDLIVPCVIGDGEAETGPTATAWHGYKYIDPAESGAVIPIVHLNGFKISQRTIYGCMDNLELVALFSGYGYQVRFVEDLEHIDNDMAASMQWALSEIKRIQKAARSGSPIVKPRWPVLILRTPKGWTGPKQLHGEFIEGSFNSHGIPLPNAATDDKEFELLSRWLESYNPSELFDKNGRPRDEILSIIPKKDRRMGQTKVSFEGYVPLDVPDWKNFVVKKGTQASCMLRVGEFLHDVIAKNPKTFRIWCPDELVSNKFEATLRDNGRNFQWDVASRNQGGRVIEMLSEHTCQGMLQGYTLTGRTGLFPSYESFMGIIHTMVVQYSKFVKKAMEVPWRRNIADDRPSISSINYVESSTWTRQEHNGFSHQNPSFIGSVLNLKATVARVYLPPDANCFLSTMAHCLRAKNYVNLMVGSKHPTPVWLSPEEADKHCIAGASVWKFASTNHGVNPDVVIVGIGVEVTMEVLAAASILREICPKLRVRVVNVTDLMILSPYGVHPHALSADAFDSLFTKDKPIHFNYHSYPIELKGLLFGRPDLERVTMEGYMEEGTTTTPFDMMLRNHVSRFHVAAAAIRGGALHNPDVSVDAHLHVSALMHEVEDHKQYAMKNATDRPGVYETPKF